MLNTEGDLSTIEEALIGLADVEEEMEKAERAAGKLIKNLMEADLDLLILLPLEISRLKSLQKIYNKRSEYIKKIDGFWHIVLSQHPEFSEYVSSRDLEYLELITNIRVVWDVSQADDQTIDPGNFAITFEFKGIDGDFPSQVVTKKFRLQKIHPKEQLGKLKSRNLDLSDGDDDTENETVKIVSESVKIIWPLTYDAINPENIAKKTSPENKKNYRAGMKSFFGWFKWTGLKPGKEFPHGDDLAILFVEDIFPLAVKYYTEAQRDGLEEEEEESDASEPLNLSEDEKANGDSKKRKCEDKDCENGEELSKRR